jgi:flagellar hook-associated protein 3 FlgL
VRITFNSQYRDAAAGIETASESLIEAQRQVASGKRISRPSHNPSAAATAVTERAQIATVEQYSRAANSVASRLTVVDSALGDIVEKLTAAQSTALSGMGSTRSAAEREAVAQSIEAIRATLLDDFNTSFHGAYIFAGAASTTKPYAISGGAVGAYAGSTTEVAVDIGDEQAVTVGFNGDTIAKGSATSHVFKTLEDLAAALRAGNDTAAQTALVALGDASTRAITAQTGVGVAMRTIEGEKARLQDIKLAGTERLSKLEDADMAEAISGMTRADAAYRAALGAAGTAARVSLLDYLK